MRRSGGTTSATMALIPGSAAEPARRMATKADAIPKIGACRAMVHAIARKNPVCRTIAPTTRGFRPIRSASSPPRILPTALATAAQSIIVPTSVIGTPRS